MHGEHTRCVNETKQEKDMKRYRFLKDNFAECECEMEESNIGEWVRYEDVPERISNAPMLSDGSIKKLLVKSFLSWPLPDSVCSDQCVTQKNAKNRTGTNLLTYTEAEQMIEYLLAAVR